MTPDPELLRSLEAVTAADPDNHAVRLHLSELLAEDGRTGDALAQCAELLRRVPGHAGALTTASRIAAAGAIVSGEDGRVPVTGEAVPAIDGAKQDDLDAFLEGILSEADAGRITLADVGGLDDVKRQLQTSFLAPLRNRKLRELYGTSLRGGLLLYGPPGCGKTFLARAVAGELGAHFMSVGLHDVLDMWLGASEKNVHQVFEVARRSSPTVLFLDEVDALGLKRTNLAKSAGRNVVVQLLTELDGICAANDGVFVLAATNQPWDLDPALRRPGRLDRTLLVVPPDGPAREAILVYHLRQRPLAHGIDLGALGKRTRGFSGADLRLVCELAAQRALEASLELDDPRPIDTADLISAVQEVQPSTRAWFETARNFVMFANADGTYDALHKYMRSERLL